MKKPGLQSALSEAVQMKTIQKYLQHVFAHKCVVSMQESQNNIQFFVLILCSLANYINKTH